MLGYMSENDSHAQVPQETAATGTTPGAEPVTQVDRTVPEPAAGYPGEPAREPVTAPAAAGAPGGWNRSGGWPAAPHGSATPTYQYPSAQYPPAQYPYPQTGQPVGGAQPGDAANPAAAYPSPWAGAQTPPAEPGQRSGGRAGRWFGAGVLALALACGGGVAGGLLVHQVDERGGTGTTVGTSSTSSNPAPTIDRTSLAGIVASVQPSVVDIKTQSGEGSGVVLTSDGYVLTNNHVVEGGGSTVSVSFSDGRTADAKVVGTDPKSDLAVVKANGVSGLTAAKFGDSSAMRVGDAVFAIGSPLGLEGSVTSGIISATNRTIVENSETNGSRNSIAGALQTDAAINPGNSGGALVNLSGQVVGINTAIATSGQGQGNIGVGFAIPSNRAKQVADQLIKGGKVSHPYLGIGVSDAPNNGGALVAQVVANSPAQRAGLRQNDVITRAGDKEIHSGDDLVSVVQSSKVGDKLTLTVTRNGSSQQITVTVGES
jgi:putative serine protease PepD